MRGWMLGAAAAAIGLAWPSADAVAHGPRHSPVRVSVGFSYGFPVFYRPYYPAPVIGIGFNVSPRHSRPAPREGGGVRSRQLFVYPAEGQTEAEMSEDRYQCHVWSADTTGFDPTLGAGSAEEAGDYGRAFSACMEGRGYVVK